MSTAKTPANIAGNTTNAAATTAVYQQLANATANITSVNTQTEWVSAKHIDTTANPQVFNTDFKFFSNSNDQFVLTSAAAIPVLVSLGANPMRVTWAPAVTWDHGGDRLRVHADINVDAVGAINLPSLLTSTQDCFFLQLWYRDGAGNYFPFASEWGYSVTNYTDNPLHVAANPNYAADLRTFAMTHPRRRFKCSVTGFLSGQATGVDRIELRARLDDAATVASVTFEEATLTAFMVRN